MIALRVSAGGLALLWVLPFYGVIDLSLLVFEDERFSPFTPLEVSWGSLFCFFLALPMVAVVFAPRVLWGALIVNASAVIALLVVAIATLSWQAAVLAFIVVAATVAFLPFVVLAVRSGQLARFTFVFEIHWVLLALAVMGVLLWAPYAVHAGRALGVLEDDVTNGFNHWPVQVGAGIAVMLGVVVAALLPEARLLGVAAVALSAASIGVSAAASPDVATATETVTWGGLAVLWGVLVALAPPVQRRRGTQKGRPDGRPLDGVATDRD